MKSFVKQDILIPRYTTKRRQLNSPSAPDESGRVDADGFLTISLIGSTNRKPGSTAAKASLDKQAKPRRRNDIRNACMNP